MNSNKIFEVYKFSLPYNVDGATPDSITDYISVLVVSLWENIFHAYNIELLKFIVIKLCELCLRVDVRLHVVCFVSEITDCVLVKSNQVILLNRSNPMHYITDYNFYELISYLQWIIL